MKKKILLILLILVIFSAAGIIYLNQVVLPVKIKSLVVQRIEEATQRKVTLDSVQFNIFKGLVLRNLVLYDGPKPLFILQEGSCTVLILPIFKKRFIIPFIKLNAPVLFLERRSDNTFNLQDLLPAHASAPRFKIFIYNLNITGGRIDFQDRTLSPLLAKSMDNLNLSLNFSLPDSVKFKLKSEVQADPRIKISAQGELKIAQRQLLGQVTIKDFSPSAFAGYYQGFGITVPGGLIDALISLDANAGVINAGLEAQSRNLNFSHKKVTVNLDASTEANLSYAFKDKRLAYSGESVISRADIFGVEAISDIRGIKGKIRFNNAGISSDRLNANILGIPIEARVRLTELDKPLLELNLASMLDLSSAQKILKDKFKLIPPADIRGEGALSVAITGRLPFARPPEINGSLDLHKAVVKLERIGLPFKDITGRIEFTSSQLKWKDMNFDYAGISYGTHGRLTNFPAPEAQVALSSDNLSLESDFTFRDKILTLTQCSGHYLNSDFSLRGSIEMADAANLEADVNGNLNIDLKDTKSFFKKIEDQIERMGPDGVLHAQFSINGNIKNIKSCAIQSRLSSPSLSLYGLKSEDFTLAYNQLDGLGEVPFMHLSLYDGTVDASAKINLKAESLPYWVSADIRGVKIEKLKLDTPMREKDISGTIQAQAKINGLSHNLSRLNGQGKVLIAGGKLWQLNLFKGLGELLFSQDFSDITFNEGSLDFIVQDEAVFTDNLKLKGEFVDLVGSAKIGFDNSIDAALNVRVDDEKAPATGTIKDVTTTIIGQAGRFGVIRISGTLKEPRYKFQPAVADILKSLKDSFLDNILQRQAF